MFSLQKIFGSGDKSFDLLTASAEEGLASVEALTRVLKDQSGLVKLDDFVESRRKNKAITQQIRELLAQASGTAIEREEIEALSIILYKVPKTIEKFAERYSISVAGFPEVKFHLQVQMLDEAMRIVLTMFRELKKNDLPAVTSQNARLQQIEGDADKLMLEQFRILYSGQFQMAVILPLKDLYEILEKAIDHCRDAGNVVAQVVLKHS
jgi:uncharacterized protein Yka (UPF0111/DUF47 family)